MWFSPTIPEEKEQVNVIICAYGVAKRIQLVAFQTGLQSLKLKPQNMKTNNKLIKKINIIRY